VVVTKRRAALFLLPALVFPAAACSSAPGPKADPFFESFYQQTQLIMLNTEKKVYRLLEDKAAREEFIKEFWRIRDPDPATEENEAKTAFEERTRYACRYFSSRWLTREWKDRDKPIEELRCWKTDMGRIYIILGPPDFIVFEGGHITAGDLDRTMIGWSAGDETWFYKDENLMLRFEREDLAGGVASDFRLLQALDEAVLNMISPGYRPDFTTGLKFKASYRRDAVVLRVPTTSTSFTAEGDKLRARFRVKMTVYRNGQRVETVETERSAETTEDSLPGQKFVALTIPYPLRGEGGYVFDIIVEDLNSPAASRARGTVKARR
jgi:GWxTD domain-containing protein